MKRTLTTGLSALCLGLAAMPSQATQARIVGGQNASSTAAPWIAGLQDQGSGRASPYCGGSLIAPRWVMTAAHCVEDANANNPNLEVLVGAHRLSANDGEVIAVDRVVVHPQYNSNTIDSDIALLRLRSAASTAPVSPATQQIMDQTPVGTDLTVRGWGVTQEGGSDQPNVLQEVDVPLVAQDNCDAELGGVTENMLCAGFASGGKDSCQGDSGGPLTREHNGRTVQMGIVSWGLGCAQANSPGVYTRVSQFTDWIDQTTGGTVSNPPPPTDPVDPPNQPDPVEPDPVEPDPGEPSPTEPDPVEPQDPGFSDLSITEYLDFGMAFLDETLEDYLLVVNESDTPTTVPAFIAEGSGQYAFDDMDCQGALLQPGDYCFIDVTFTASQVGESEALLSIGDAESMLFAVTVSESDFGFGDDDDFGDFGDGNFDDDDYYDYGGYDDDFDSWYDWGDDDWYFDQGDFVTDVFGDEEDYLSTECFGEGELSFDWIGSGDIEADYFVDGARRATLSGGRSNRVTMQLPEGQHRLHWVARKQGQSNGQLRISNLQFTPRSDNTPAASAPPSNSASAAPANNAAGSGGAGATSPLIALMALIAVALRRRMIKD